MANYALVYTYVFAVIVMAMRTAVSIKEAAHLRQGLKLLHPCLVLDGTSGQWSDEWLQCTQMALHFALPAKHRLYNVPLICDQVRLFVTTACLLIAQSYCAQPKPSYSSST